MIIRTRLSVVLPCLNEEESIGQSIDKIQKIFLTNNINGEIIVVDNNSMDNSAEIIKKTSAKYIFEPKRGYGNAYLSGFKHISGEYIIMVDPDNSYDLNEIPNFLKELENNDFVIGYRIKKRMEKGAMPFSHKYIWSPIIKIFLMINGVYIKETCTGFVGLKKQVLNKLDLKQSGMEFSSEMLVKVAQLKLSIKEIEIDYRARSGKSKINKLRDGLRHLKFLSTERIKTFI